MKINKLLLFTFIFVLSGFLLTACGNDTSYISDQTGKEIPVTSSDSDTYTFKLPAVETEVIEAPSVEIPEETEPTTVESEPVEEDVPEEPLATEGPKTGEP